VAVKLARHLWANLGTYATDASERATASGCAEQLRAHLRADVGTKERTEQGDSEELINRGTVHKGPLIRTSETTGHMIYVVKITPRSTTKK